MTRTSTSSSECSATRSPSTRSALARPRSSSASGRSMRAIRRTSSRLPRAVSCASITPSRDVSLTSRATRPSCSTTPVSVCPTPSWSSCATRSRSPSCAASARRTLSRRSASSRSSISLKAAASSAASESPPPISSRWPGSSGSIRRANCVSSRSGASACRSSSRLSASMSTRPPLKIASSRSATSSTLGANTNAVIVHAAASTAALPMASRQKSAGPRERANTDAVWRSALAACGLIMLTAEDSGATDTPTEACSRGSGREHAASETVGNAGGPYVHVARRRIAAGGTRDHGGNHVTERGGQSPVKHRRRTLDEHGDG